MSGQLHAPAALLPGKELSLHKGSGGTHRRSGLCGIENNHLLLPEIEPRLLGGPNRSLVILPTEVSDSSEK
jgi:hypothetical protein